MRDAQQLADGRVAGFFDGDGGSRFDEDAGDQVDGVLGSRGHDDVGGIDADAAGVQHPAGQGGAQVDRAHRRKARAGRGALVELAHRWTVALPERAWRIRTPADVADLDEERDLGRPGEFPFTRGVQPTMYRGRLWTMRQYAGFATAAETNRRFRYLLEQGQTGLSVAFDLPTQMGYDSDAPQAEGEVGRVGVPISSLADMQVLLDGLPLGEVSTSMTINATAPILLALYVAVAEGAGVPRDRIAGTTQNDILKEYIARGTYIYPPRPSMRLVTLSLFTI